MKIFLSLAALLFIGCIDYSDGNRAGTLVKFSRKGLVCKTWEGSLNLGGMVQGENGPVANVWDFSIDSNVPGDTQFIEPLNLALAQGRRVRIAYMQEFIVGPCRASSTYFVKGVSVE